MVWCEMQTGTLSFRSDIVRVYYNAGDAEEKAWSIDFGPQTAELLLRRVITAPGETKVNLQEENKEANPTAWLEIRNANVTLNLKDGMAVITGEQPEH